MLLSAFLLCFALKAQDYTVKLHSHNDYRNVVPFHLAYSQGIESIECDMFYTKGQFLVGHDLEDLDPKMTFERLYLNPILDFYYRNEGKAWSESDKRLQLMLEVKSGNTKVYLKALVRLLAQYPEVFDPEYNPNAVRIVITGFDMPDQAFLDKLPSYIMFDGEYDDEYTQKQLERIYMYSTNFSRKSSWRGGKLSAEDEAAIRKCIDDTHAKGKLFRFWGAPDSPEAWQRLYELGVDFVGTDSVIDAARYFSKLK